MRRVHLKPPQSPRTALYGHFPNMTEPWGDHGVAYVKTRVDLAAVPTAPLQRPQDLGHEPLQQRAFLDSSVFVVNEDGLDTERENMFDLRRRASSSLASAVICRAPTWRQRG